MISPLELASDVMSAATALAGLILVFLGSVASGFASYEKPQQAAVLKAFQRRAWFGFVGFVAAVAAACLGLSGKLLASPGVVGVGIFFAMLYLPNPGRR